MRLEQQGTAWRKTIGPGDVENRVMSTVETLRTAVAELHGDGTLGDTLKVLEAAGAIGFGEAYSGIVLVETGIAYIDGYRSAYSGAYLSVPQPYVAVEAQELTLLESEGPGQNSTRYELAKEDVVDDGSFVLYKRNSATGVDEALTRYSQYTLDAAHGIVTLLVELGAEEELRATYRFRVPGILFVELDQQGTLHCSVGTSVAEDSVPGQGGAPGPIEEEEWEYTPGAADDPYFQSAYNGYFALPPTASTGTILLAKLYYPGPKGKLYRNMEEDATRELTGLSADDIISGDYGIIDDERRILTPAEDLLDFQQAFNDMIDDMNSAVAGAELALSEGRLRAADLDGEGIVTGVVPTGGMQSMYVNISAGVAYIEQHLAQHDWLMRVVVPSQTVQLDEPTDAPSENRTVTEGHLYSPSTTEYALNVEPATTILSVSGEVAYRYTQANPALLTKRLSGTFSASKPADKPTDALFDATCTALTTVERAKLEAADSNSAANDSAAENLHHSLHVFKVEHPYAADKAHTISYRWDGTGSGGAELFIFNFSTGAWVSLGTVGATLASLQGTITTNVANYISDGGSIYFAAASTSASDGSTAVSVTSDYFYINLYAGHYVVGDLEQGESVPNDSYNLAGNTVVFEDDRFAYPRAGTTFAVQYYAALPRYDALQVGLDGTVHVVKGTPAESPVIPTINDEHLLVANVLVRHEGAVVASTEAADNDNALYDRRQVIWTGDEGQAAREDASSLVKNLRMRTYELHGNVVSSGCRAYAYPSAAGSSIVRVGSGVYYALGYRREYAGSLLTYNFGSLADSEHRRDIIYMDTEGVVYNALGTPVALTEVAEPPDRPAGTILIAYVEMTADLVAASRVPQTAISDMRTVQGQPDTGGDDGEDPVVVVDNNLLAYFNELGGEGLLAADVSVVAKATPSRSVDLSTATTSRAYISGQRVLPDAMASSYKTYEVSRPGAIAATNDENPNFHPFISLPQESAEANYFNLWSHLSPIEGLQFPLQSVSRIKANAWCDHTFRRAHGAAHTNRAWHLSYTSLAVDPESLPGAAEEFDSDGFEVNGEPVLINEYESYENMMFSDGIAATSESSPDNGHYMMHVFAFRHVTNGGTVARIKARWDGTGEKPDANNDISYGAILQIWNGSSWETLADYDEDNLGTDVAIRLEGQVTRDLDDYRQTDDYIYIRVYNPLAADGTRGSELSTDFVCVWVLENGRWMVPNKVYNGHFEHGTGMPYGWEVVQGSASWDSSQADSLANKYNWYKDWDWLDNIDTGSRTEMDSGFYNDFRSKCLSLSNGGSDTIRVRQRFAIDQDSGTAFLKRPVRFSFDYWRNITEGEQDENFSVRLRLWNVDNELEADNTIMLDVGSGSWEEKVYNFIPEKHLSYGEVTILLADKTGTAKFDNFRLVELPDGTFETVDDETTFYSFYVEHDYEVGQDRIDWRCSGFDPYIASDYEVTYRHWLLRTDSCQLTAGNSFAVYTGAEGATATPPPQQLRCLELARIVIRGDRPIKDADDGWCSYIANLNPVIFTGDEGVEHRVELAKLQAELGPLMRNSFLFGCTPTRVSSTKVTVGIGAYWCDGVEIERLEVGEAGTPGGESGRYYLVATADANGAPTFSWVYCASGWPSSGPAVMQISWDKDAGTFADDMVDLRDIQNAPPPADAVGVLSESVFSDQHFTHVFNFRT